MVDQSIKPNILWRLNSSTRYNYFSESEIIYRISDIYFTSKNKGCFIASNICGVDCEEANIYSFEIIKPDKYLFKLVCPYFVT